MKTIKLILKKILPLVFQEKITDLKRLFSLQIGYYLQGIGKNRQEIFQDIYLKKRWGDSPQSAGFFSGPGSTALYTQEYENLIVDFLDANGIETILDIGCGDFQVGRRILDRNPTVKYIGVDIVFPLIERNKKLFSDNRIAFQQVDAVNDILPQAEVVLIREVLQHLSIKSVQVILNKLDSYQYVFITEHCTTNTKEPNIEISEGRYARVDFGSGTFVELPPFNRKCREVLVVPLSDKTTCLRTVLMGNDYEAAWRSR